ncbi:hypothetical protein I317_00612 [Kwoniella heveanensis CBS 569]|nr:hypothetical protein I317_00612 [Kwoniella heveanensis CBS 569]
MEWNNQNPDCVLPTSSEDLVARSGHLAPHSRFSVSFTSLNEQRIAGRGRENAAFVHDWNPDTIMREKSADPVQRSLPADNTGDDDFLLSGLPESQHTYFLNSDNLHSGIDRPDVSWSRRVDPASPVSRLTGPRNHGDVDTYLSVGTSPDFPQSRNDVYSQSTAYQHLALPGDQELNGQPGNVPADQIIGLSSDCTWSPYRISDTPGSEGAIFSPSSWNGNVTWDENSLLYSPSLGIASPGLDLQMPLPRFSAPDTETISRPPLSGPADLSVLNPEAEVEGHHAYSDDHMSAPRAVGVKHLQTVPSDSKARELPDPNEGFLDSRDAEEAAYMAQQPSTLLIAAQSSTAAMPPYQVGNEYHAVLRVSMRRWIPVFRPPTESDHTEHYHQPNFTYGQSLDIHSNPAAFINPERSNDGSYLSPSRPMMWYETSQAPSEASQWHSFGVGREQSVASMSIDFSIQGVFNTTAVEHPIGRPFQADALNAIVDGIIARSTDVTAHISKLESEVGLLKTEWQKLVGKDPSRVQATPEGQIGLQASESDEEEEEIFTSKAKDGTWKRSKSIEVDIHGEVALAHVIRSFVRAKESRMEDAAPSRDFVRSRYSAQNPENIR